MPGLLQCILALLQCKSYQICYKLIPKESTINMWRSKQT